MAIIDLTKENFQAEITKSDKPVLVDFWAVWCGPCQMMAPILHELEAEMPDVQIGKVNVDEQMDLARQFRFHGKSRTAYHEAAERSGSGSGADSKRRID